jgi:DNA-binding MarR family transcriptional regulator
MVEVDESSYVALAELRYRIRKFIAFSERASRDAGLEPQHHQLLLAIKGLPEGEAATLGMLAERLQIQHHSCVELAARAESNGLVERSTAKDDKRKRIVGITRKGERLLAKLSEEHIAELSAEAPALYEALRVLARGQGKAASKKTTDERGKPEKDAPSWQKNQPKTARAIRSST